MSLLARSEREWQGRLLEAPRLGACRVGSFEVSPPLGDLAVGDSPNDDSGEFEALTGCGVGAIPVVANDHFVVFGDELFNDYPQVGNFFECGADVLDGARGPRREAGRDVGAVIEKVGCEIHTL